jgi:hypothetical protein
LPAPASAAAIFGVEAPVLVAHQQAASPCRSLRPRSHDGWRCPPASRTSSKPILASGVFSPRSTTPRSFRPGRPLSV